MRVFMISEEQSSVLDLLQNIKGEEGVILQTTDGQKFLLSPLNNWHGFEVQDTEDFEQEVKSTSKNSELLEFLSTRNQNNPNSNKQRVSIAQVKNQLGL
ncbi:MAG: hypothetical protein ACO3NK_19480 [Prochlorotrichaceae cyanobacterium]